MPTSTETLPADIAADIANLPRIETTEEWLRNRDKLIGAKCLVEYISWANPNIDPFVMKTVDGKDQLAEAEAERTGKLRVYVRGEVNPDAPDKPYRNWCGWDSFADAHAAIQRPDHKDAADYALEENIYRFVFLRVSNLYVPADPNIPEIIESVREMTLPQLLAHRAINTV